MRLILIKDTPEVEEVNRLLESGWLMHDKSQTPAGVLVMMLPPLPLPVPLTKADIEKLAELFKPCGGRVVQTAPDKPKQRTKSEVMAARERPGGGCCDRYCDNMACYCLEKALPDKPKCPLCNGAGWCQGGRLDNDSQTVRCACVGKA